MKKVMNGFTLIELMIVVAIIAILAGGLLNVGSVGIYGFMNSKHVTGDIVSVTSAIPENGMVVGNGTSIFSAAVMLKSKNGEYVSFSSDDRQWATLRSKEFVGTCVTATVYPYAPWNLSKAGTLHGGRLMSFTNKPCA